MSIFWKCCGGKSKSNDSNDLSQSEEMYEKTIKTDLQSENSMLENEDENQEVVEEVMVAKVYL